MRLAPLEIVPELIAFNGGVDVVTPTFQIPPGFCRLAQNFEQDINGGYTRIKGYERFDGRTKPSSADYAVLACAITGTVAVGDILTDNTAAAFGTVISLPSGQAILTKVTGTFAVGNIKVGSTVVGTCSAAQVVSGASTALLHATYKNLAADQYRNDIGAVPGSGNVLGVCVHGDTVYAFRANSGATAVDLYKSTASGWSNVPLGRKLKFSTGTATVSEGQTLTGATSGATGVVKRVAIRSGSIGAGTAAGDFIFASVTGTFQNAENLQVGGVTKAVAASADTAITLATGGRFEFVYHNFGGSVATRRVYGCDGANPAFEFDGTVLVPITTTMTTDTPSHIAAHKNHLFLSFGASVQHSSTGSPYVFSVVTGAGEIAMGDDVTGFVVQPGGAAEGALAIFSRNNISVLYGNSSSDWKLTPFDQQAGGYANTLQHIGFTVALDDRGLISLATSQAYGNFASATLSKRVQTWLRDKRQLATASCVIRDKNQYRIFFSDRTALYVTFDNGEVAGIMTQLFSHAVRCTASVELSDGTEAAFFGSTDGYVYQMEKGTSFDGGDIEAYLHLVFNNSGNNRMLKRYFGGALEVSGDGYAAFNAFYELGYGSTNVDQPGVQSVSVSFASAYWDAATWDQFVWDSNTLTPSEFDMVGTAENASLKLLSTGDYFQPFRLAGAVIRYAPRRLMRNNL